MAKIIWSKTATNQLKRQVQFIKQERGRYYAELVLSRILDGVTYLERFPKLGTIEPLLQSRRFEYRFLVVWRYKIIYRVSDKKVYISRVFETSQKPTKIFKR